VHRIIVPISRTRLAGWALKGNELIRVLFEYGKRHVEECVRADELPATEETIRYPEITPDTHPETSCPFDAGAIPWPKGVQQFVEQHRS